MPGRLDQGREPPLAYPDPVGEHRRENHNLQRLDLPRGRGTWPPASRAGEAVVVTKITPTTKDQLIAIHPDPRPTRARRLKCGRSATVVHLGARVEEYYAHLPNHTIPAQRRIRKSPSPRRIEAGWRQTGTHVGSRTGAVMAHNPEVAFSRTDGGSPPPVTTDREGVGHRDRARNPDAQGAHAGCHERGFSRDGSGSPPPAWTGRGKCGTPDRWMPNSWVRPTVNEPRNQPSDCKAPDDDGNIDDLTWIPSRRQRGPIPSKDQEQLAF